MSDIQIYLTLGIFAAVILAIAFDVIDMAVAALLGVCLMMALGLLGGDDLVEAMKTAGGPLALLFGGMVVAHVLGKTGIAAKKRKR
jgi:Na+/H+ antiporter NhaD/arsenite permease-like protein